MRLLVTGGLGFIGSNFIRLVLRRPGVEVTNLDAMTYAGNPASLRDVEADPRYRFIRGDVADADAVTGALDRVDAVIHFAAESHVDRSIKDPGAFVRTNVVGTQTMVEAVRACRGVRLVVVSTDEVYGSLTPEQAPFTEETPLDPTSPYAASKAGGDLMALAAAKTHGADIVITRCSNNYGPYQYPEKFIPLMITNALEGKPLPIYGDGRQVRDWIHVDDHARGVLAALEHGVAGRVYNFGAENEHANLDIVTRLQALVGPTTSALQYVTDRLAHDRRYAINSARARRELQWAPEVEFDAGLAATVAWYQSHAEWWRPIKEGTFRAYYDRHYTRSSPASAATPT